MTFGEFNQECKLYRYSQDYFTLVKEASELDLMALLIHQQEYAIECQEIGYDIPGNFFIEGSNDNINSIFIEASSQLINKIKTRVASICTTIAKFFKKLASRAVYSVDQNAINDHLKNDTDEQIESRIKKICAYVSNNKSKVAATLGVIGASTVAGAVTAVQVNKALKQIRVGINITTNNLGLEDSDAAIVAATIKYLTHNKSSTVELKVKKKVLTPEQISDIEREIKKAIQWAKTNDGSKCPASIGKILEGGDKPRIIKVACDRNNFERYSATFDNISKLVTEFNVIARDNTTNLASNVEYKEIVDDVAKLYDWISNTQEFYVRWDKIITFVHNTLIGQISSKITTDEKDDML